MRRASTLALTLAAAGAVLLTRPAATEAWGDAGHRLIGKAAADALPPAMPAFFRRASLQLAYLNPEPDRWRERAERELDPALDAATAPDHFLNADMVPTERLVNALAAPSRYAYADTLRALRLDAPTVGVLPFRIVELTQRLRVDFRLWRVAPDSTTRRWIEQRIIDDAGILGHYVADGSNPMHTSKHYNGWASGVDNPRGYSTDRTMHGRFESAFVQAQIVPGAVTPLIARDARVHDDVRAGTIAYLRRSSAELTRLYDLEKQAPFTPTTTSAPHRAFVATRLAAGATMLRDLWWTAWVTSGMPVAK